MRTTSSLRLAIVLVVMSATLTHAWSAPATTISVPETMVRSVHALSEHHQRVRLDYPATHLAFSWRGPAGSAVSFRTVSSDGERSPWVQAPEVHGGRRSEMNGRHFSAVLAVDRVVEVEWSGTAPDDGRIQRVTLDYLNTIDGPRREVRIPNVASASSAPAVVTRAEWGADESLRRNRGCARSFYKLQQIFVHHTAGQNYDANPKATMRAIYWYHVVRQGWCDIGYNFVIGPEGTVFEGRWARRYKPWELHDGETPRGHVVAGAHAEGHNSGSLGVSLMGNYSQIPLPPAARRSLVELLAWEVDRHGLDPRGKHTYRNPETGATRVLPVIAGHRDAGRTACPGSFVYKDLSRIRREVETARGTGRAGSHISLTPTDRRVPYGQPAVFTGTLKDASGSGLAGRPIWSYVKEGARRWRAGPDTFTDDNGTYSFQVAVERNTKVIAVYEGDLLTWGAQSPIARVGISPSVTIRTEGSTADAGGFSHYPTGTEEVVLSGSVDPPHADRSVVVRVSKLEGTEYVPVAKGVAELNEDSVYSFKFAPDDLGGTYEAVAIFEGDEDHSGARSAPVTFVVDP